MTTDASPTPVLAGVDLPEPGFAFARVSGDGADRDDRGPVLVVVVDGHLLDLAAVATTLGASATLRTAATDLLPLLENWDTALDEVEVVVARVRELGVEDTRLAGHVIHGVQRLHSPLRRPSKILCSAQNYPDHVEEMRKARERGFNPDAIDESKDFTGDRATTRPYMFLKAPSAVTGPYDDITLPPGTSQIDWEVELGVVIGRAARHVRAADAVAHIAGYVATNDVTARDLLFRPDRERLRSDWMGGKSHDGFAPMGPVFVPRRFVPDPDDIRLTLSVNGVAKQDGSTAHLIYSAEEQIEYASRIMTLEPGDVINTGTPGGVGQGSDTFLSAGDVVEATVQGVGTLRNRFVG